jgi:hypothetical protein
VIRKTAKVEVPKMAKRANGTLEKPIIHLKNKTLNYLRKLVSLMVSIVLI